MTQQEIAIEIAAELAAASAVDAFGEEIPSAQTAWEFINEQIYEEEGRPLHLPENMPNGFDQLYLVAAARLIQKRKEPCTCGHGEGKHHPDCPEWDSHVDNYEATV